MRYKEQLELMYNYLQNDKELLRLLYYKPKNQLDDPLDSTKKEVLELENSYKILESILVPSDKKYNLDTERNICRICFYDGSRIPQSFRGLNGTRLNNNQVSHQEFIFDVYVHLDVDTVDFRMAWICDRLNAILANEDIIGESEMWFTGSTPIKDTPDGYIGKRMAYTFTSLQEYGKQKGIRK
ncbi:hypothetical protein ACFVRU_47740 [Streptomyces sp. NPDC057927]